MGSITKLHDSTKRRKPLLLGVTPYQFEIDDVVVRSCFGNSICVLGPVWNLLSDLVEFREWHAVAPALLCGAFIGMVLDTISGSETELSLGRTYDTPDHDIVFQLERNRCTSIKSHLHHAAPIFHTFEMLHDHWICSCDGGVVCDSESGVATAAGWNGLSSDVSPGVSTDAISSDNEVGFDLGPIRQYQPPVDSVS